MYDNNGFVSTEVTAVKTLLPDSDYEELTIQNFKRLKISEYIKIMLEENHVDKYISLYSEIKNVPFTSYVEKGIISKK